jgi:predicted metal-dependent enzyme (double-stranded beta helix superfamily)
MRSLHYPISRLVADLRALRDRRLDEREMLSAIRPLARRAALSASDWVEPRMYRADTAQGFAVNVLHEEADHTLAVFAVSWLPHRGVPAHDHGTWAVVVGVDGEERNEFFERLDDRSRPGYAEIRKVGETRLGVGEVLAMPNGIIHSVVNDSDTVTLSLHVYGKHVNYTGRSQYDPGKNTETPIVLALAD